MKKFLSVLLALTMLLLLVGCKKSEASGENRSRSLCSKKRMKKKV